VDLKMLEDYVDEDGIGNMMDQDKAPTQEEYDDMVVEECPEDDNEEAMDKYLNMELTMGVGTDAKRRGQTCSRIR